jgi:hypothetical protein
MIEIYIVDGREFKVHSSRKEEFLQKYPKALLKQTEPGKTSPTAPGAVVEETVAPASQSMGLGSENILLDSVPEPPKQIESQKLSSGQYDMLSDYIGELAKSEREKPEEPFTYTGALANAALNIPSDLQTAWESTKTFAVDYIKNVAGGDAADFLIGKDKKYKKGDIVNVAELGREAEKYIIDQYKEVENLRSQRLKAGKIVEEFDIKDPFNAEFTSGPELFSGITNVVGSLISTVVPAALTRGASLGPQITAPMYIDYNVQKAERLYGNDPNAIKKLVENNETEIAVPLALGTLASGLEYVGFKGITKQIAARAGGLKPLVSLLGTQNKEGITEVTQTGLEVVNTSLAEGESLNDAIADGFSAMVSADGLESFLGGFIGSGVIAGPSSVAKALRSDEGSMKTVMDHIEAIGILQKQRSLNKDKSYRSAIDLQIQDVEKSLKTFLEDTYIKTSLLSKEQRNELDGFIKQKEENQTKLKDLEKSYNDKKITGQQYGLAKGIIANQNKAISNGIVKIKNSIDLDKTGQSIAEREEMLKKAQEQGVLPDLKMKSFDKQSELEDYVTKTKGVKKFEGKYGVIYQNPNTNEQEILINKEQKLKDKVVTTADHEFLHAILYQTVKNNPETQSNLGKALHDELIKQEGLDEIVSSDYFKRLQSYLAQIEQIQNPTLEQQKEINRQKGDAWEESLTLYAEGLANGAFKTPNKSFIQKIKEFFEKLFGKNVANDITFNEGKDVIKFVQDYNKSFQTGKWGEGIKKLAKEGAKGKLIVSPESKSPQFKEFTNKASKIFKDPKPIFASDLSPFDQYDFVQVAANSMFPDVAAQDNVKAGQFSTYEALSADQKLELIEDLLDKGGLKPKFSRSVSPDKKDLKGIFDKFVQTPNGKRKYKALDDFRKSEDYFDAYNEVAEGDAIGKYVRGLVNADKNLGSLDENIKSEVISNVREVITERFLKNFDPAKNESLFGYLFGSKPIVDFALRDVKKKYAQRVKTVSTDIETEGRSFEAVDTESAQIEEIVDRSLTEEQQTFESQLKSTLTVGSQPFITPELAQEIRKAAYETFEGALPPIDSRDFRKFVTDSYKKKLMPIIKKALGNKKKLADFVVENKQDLLEGLPISYWVQIERLLPDTQKIFTKYIKRLTTQAEIDKYTALGRVYTENDADGPELYQVLNPTNEQIQAFFTGPVSGESMSDILGYTVSPSTLAARKSELGANIGLQAASDATPGAIQTKPYTEQEAAKIALKVNRDLRQKFSLSGKNTRAIDSAELVKYIKDGLSNSEIASKLAVPESYVGAMVDRLKSEFPANGNKQYGQDQIEYINDNQFNLISVIDGIATVSGGLTLNLIDKNGKLTPNGQEYAKQQIDFAVNYIQQAIGEETGDHFQRFTDFIRFEGRNIRQGSMYFTTNQQAWDNVYSKIIEKTPEFEGIFKIKNGRIYIGEGQITALKDPTNKKFRMGVEMFKPEFDIQSKKALEYFKDRIDYLKSKGDINMARTYLQLETGDMRTALKLLGIVSYIEKGNFNNLVYEHMTPSSLLARMSMSYLISDKLISRDLLFEKLENSKVALVSKQTDNELTTLGYKEVGEELTRYDKTGIKERLTPLEPKEITQKLSKSAAPEFNKMIARATGFGTREQISDKVATMLGKNKGRFRFFIPPSADDFAGLMYYMVGKGKQGNNDLKFLKENLFDPFGSAIRKFDSAKQKRLADFRELKKLIRRTPTRLSRKNETGFTNEDSVRIYIWNSLGYTIPGMQKKDIAPHVKLVKGNEDLLAFAQNVQGISIMGYPEPDNGWDAGSMTTDLLTYVNKTERSEYLKPWQAAKDAFFTDKTMNKLKAAFGESYTEALEDILYRMENGRRRPAGANKLTNSLINWVNDSVGAIMFFNSRSALLQQLSMVNFINFSDNNPLSAGAAFANQPQFWKDYTFLFNSDFLKQRRSGLKTDVNADEIAKAAESGTNPVRSVIASILKKGFLPTQLADSHAIAMGGASFYRNRLKRYIKEGMTEQEAADKAFLDFQEVAEETQQSSRPDRISMQQASGLGRVILAFANTPMQYARLSKKAVLDLANRRGDWKTNLSKLMYYSVVQNIIFSSLQSAMFALMFTDEEDEETEKRYYRIANSTADSLLRGIGFAGAAVATGKNMVLEVIRQYKSGRPNYEKIALGALSLSPPIDSKISKLASAGRSFTYRQSREKMRTEGISLDNPAFEAVGQIIAATTNLPADRVIRKLDNLSTPVRQDVETWQAISLALGYSKWDVGLIESQTKKLKSNKRKQTKRKQVERKQVKR